MAPTLQHDVSLRPFNTFGIDVRALHFAHATSIEDLHALRAAPVWARGPVLILGGGSNLLLCGDVDGLVVHMALRGRALLREDAAAWYVRVAAGESWHETVQWTLQHGWPGLENLALIPGSAGAAPIQNIGAYGLELAERLDHVEALDCRSGALVTLDRDACRFGYRDSVFKGAERGRYLITAVVLRLPKVWTPLLDYGDLRATLAAAGGGQPTARAVADAVIAIRRAKLPDPAALGNAGSFFKNPLVGAAHEAELRRRHPDLVSHAQPDGRYKLAAGWLIERCGWKGRALPGSAAAVHDRQALVLVNRGGASGADILALARAIQADVRARFGVELLIEPDIVPAPLS